MYTGLMLKNGIACTECGLPIRSDNTTGICSRKTCIAAYSNAQYYRTRKTGPPCTECGLPLSKNSTIGICSRESCALAFDRARSIRRWPVSRGLEHGQYEALLAEQGGVCAVCGRLPEGRRLAVDHDHACCPKGKACGQCVRGLLCFNCNAAIGQAGESADRLLQLAAYLVRHSERT